MTEQYSRNRSSHPSKEDLLRMYDIIQADAALSNRVASLGFGRNGDAYRRAAAKLKVMGLVKLMKDGKRIRNNVVHKPGYVPSKYDALRTLAQYDEAQDGISRAISG